MSEEPKDWEYLREDIILLPGPTKKSGSPTWTLHDPAAGQFYRIGWMEFEILKRWHFAQPQKILQDISAVTLLRPTPEDIISLYQFLKSSSLLNTRTSGDVQNLLQIKVAKSQKNWFQALLKNYLFFRIPLIKPDNFLNIIEPFIGKIFQKIFLQLVLVLALIGGLLVLRDFDSFLSGFSTLQSPSGMIMGALTLAFAKIVHEAGHAFACKHYGCRVPSMGVAFIVLWPLLWTDTTDAWRLTDKRKRLLIDGAGMIAELSLAAIASIIWALSPEGLLKDSMHVLAGVTWIMTLFVNLNPFMRFDGYYLLSDMLDIPNLQDRSFKLAKNWMRKWLWNMDEAKPERFSVLMEKGLILYSFGTWIYRFFLFLGIALVVYHFFFKALGVSLMIVEIWWFIVRPILNELKYWIEQKEKMNLSKQQKNIWGILPVILVIFILIPWQSNISAPAIIKGQKEIPLLVSRPSIIKEIHVKDGENVKFGDVLFTLENPDIDYEIKKIQLEKNMLEKDFKNKIVDDTYYQEGRVISEKLHELQASLNLKKAEKQALTILSPIDGVIVDIPEYIRVGSWISKKEYLGLVRSKNIQIDAFVTETDIARIDEKVTARFYSSQNFFPPLKGTVTVINAQAVSQIPYQELGSDYGGDIIMSVASSGAQLIPQESRYKISIKSEKNIDISKTSTGTVKIKSERQSLLTKFSRKALSILIQESSF